MARFWGKKTAARWGPRTAFKGLVFLAGLGALLCCSGLWDALPAAAEARPGEEEYAQKIAATAAKVQPALVTVLDSAGQSQSGLIMDGEAGLVASSARLLLGNKNSKQTYTVILPGGRKYPAQVVAVGRDVDLAVWRLDAPGTRFPEAPLGDSARLRVGESVIAVSAKDNTASWGIISAVNRNVAGQSGLIQTDARLGSDSSGEALLNLNGEVVGLVTSLPSLFLSNSRGLGFAVPSGHLAEAREHLKARPPRRAAPPHCPSQPAAAESRPARNFKPYLGLRVVNYLNPGHNQPPARGCLIESVDPGSPGERAGLKAGDIIVSLADQITSDIEAYQRTLAASMAGGTAWLEFFRSGRPLMVQMIIEEREEE